MVFVFLMKILFVFAGQPRNSGSGTGKMTFIFLLVFSVLLLLLSGGSIVLKLPKTVTSAQLK